MIPTGSDYPENLDTDQNLFLVHDALRMTLAEDYNPGDSTITVFGDAAVMNNFPSTGFITLTDQCNDLENRATSFYYSSKTTSTFEGLEILPEFTDVIKSKNITHITQNVMSEHHNAIKDAVIAIEQFIGKKGTIDLVPSGDTIEGRTNFLRKLVLSPKAWFTANKNVGLTPLTVEFQDLSFRLGTDGTSQSVTFLWNFGDQTSSIISIISVTDSVPINDINVLVYDIDGGPISKTYTNPGIYDVTLTVTNDFGSDEIKFSKFIQARAEAPIEATIQINPITGQILSTGPKIRSTTNKFIELEVPPGENLATPGYTYAGEFLVGLTPLDPVITYTWALSDDLLHSNSNITRASYSIGGLYDLILRVDTTFGSYRITEYNQSIDIVESTNLWLWNFTTFPTVVANEFGLISETFKTASTTLNATSDDSFLNLVSNSVQQKREFNRNVGFVPRGTIPSGSQGTNLLFWASGRTIFLPASSEKINIAEYNGFTDSYVSHAPIFRPWNWIFLGAPSSAYFLLGTTTSPVIPNSSPTNQTRDAYSYLSLSNSSLVFNNTNYTNGANELMQNVSIFDNSGSSVYGHFSVYRTTWKDNNGYIIRNDGIGPFFRLRSFYRTEGDISDPVQIIKKLPDMTGSTKFEGQLVPLSQGVYFFNNSGAVSAYNTLSGVWNNNSVGSNSAAFRSLQDTTVSGFDDASNTLLAASDSDRKAYLSYDYSPNVFIRFNEVDTTFSLLGSRPNGNQWQIGIY